MNSGYIPFDVITGVLCRLPVKTLIRFKSLSKQCHSLVEDPYFIKSHLERSKNSLILRKSGSEPKLYLVGMDSLELITEFDYLPKFRDSIVQECSCNGLIVFCCRPSLLRGGEETFTCWNFATREQHIIPPPYSFMGNHGWCSMVSYSYAYFKLWPTATMVLDNYRRGCGFGYDSVSDDYKLILIESTSELGYISMVYSMKRNHWEWRRIPLNLSICQSRGFFVKGYLNWPVQSDIFAFALDTEEFCQVPLPDIYRVPPPDGIERLVTLSVGILGGCLMMNLDNLVRGYKYNVWVMKDYMVRESWTKLYVYLSPSVLIKAFGHISSSDLRVVPIKVIDQKSSSDELLLRVGGRMIDNKLFRYNVVTGAMEEDTIKGLADWGTIYDGLVSVESLIPINKLFGRRSKPAITQGKEGKVSLSLTYQIIMLLFFIIMLLLFIVACFLSLVIMIFLRYK